MEIIDKTAITFMLIVVWSMIIGHIENDKLQLVCSILFICGVSFLGLFFTFKILYGVWS